MVRLYSISDGLMIVTVKTKVLRKNLFLYHFVHYKSQWSGQGLNPGLCIELPEQGTSHLL